MSSHYSKPQHLTIINEKKKYDKCPVCDGARVKCIVNDDSFARCQYWHHWGICDKHNITWINKDGATKCGDKCPSCYPDKWVTSEMIKQQQQNRVHCEIFPMNPSGSGAIIVATRADGSYNIIKAGW